MPLSSLANEILLLVSEQLILLRDVSSFLRTNKRLSALLTPHLYARAKPYNLLDRLTQVGHIRPVIELLDGGASFTEAPYDVPYPFYTAVKCGHEEIVKLMISRSTERLPAVCKPILKGRTVLHKAAENGHDGIVRLLLQAGFSEMQQTDDGETPLVFAVKGGHEQVVRTLFEFGASPNIILDSWRPKFLIHWVAANFFALMTIRGCNLLSILRMMLDNNANVMARDHYRATPLHYCAKNGEAVVGAMLASLEGCEQKLAAAKVAYDEMVTLLIERGADCNARDQGGRTPLHNAAEQLDVYMVRKLLESGADRRLLNGVLKTAQRLASDRGWPRSDAVVALLGDWSIGPS